MEVDWENQVGSRSPEKEFVECLQDGFWEQLVVEATGEPVILDLVTCNEADLIREFKVKQTRGSDYNMIEFILLLKKEKIALDVIVLHVSKANYKDMKEDLARVAWKGSPLEKMYFKRAWVEVSVVAITKEKVLGILKGLRMDKSPRPDGLHPRVLKEIADEIVEALVIIQ
eukprot:g42236.t1